MHRVKATCLIAAACLGFACSLAAAESVPKPRLRPAPELAVSPAAAIPIPKLRPAQDAAAPDSGAAPEAPEGGAGWPAAVIAAEKANCAKLLDGLDIDYAPLDPIGRDGGCGAPAPVEVTAVAGVKLEPPATQTCAMAAAMAGWVKEDVQPAAKKRLGTEVTVIRTATSYACRRRNNASSGKMSEHAKANALDMSGFSFAKTQAVAVGGKGNWGEGLLAAIGLSKNGSFLEDIRKAACTHFTTVLGPGSDPYHGDHFHVDVLQRKGGFRICQ
jgi:hypothetical protein